MHPPRGTSTMAKIASAEICDSTELESLLWNIARRMARSEYVVGSREERICTGRGSAVTGNKVPPRNHANEPNSQLERGRDQAQPCTDANGEGKNHCHTHKARVAFGYGREQQADPYIEDQ